MHKLSEIKGSVFSVYQNKYSKLIFNLLVITGTALTAGLTRIWMIQDQCDEKCDNLFKKKIEKKDKI